MTKIVEANRKIKPYLRSWGQKETSAEYTKNYACLQKTFASANLRAYGNGEAIHTERQNQPGWKGAQFVTEPKLPA